MRTAQEVYQRVIELRAQLTAGGPDAEPVTIASSQRFQATVTRPVKPYEAGTNDATSPVRQAGRLADLVPRRVAAGLVGKHSSARSSSRAAINGFSESERDR